MPGVEPDPSLHQSAAQTATLHLVVVVRGGRADRTRAGTRCPGPRISNPVPYQLGQPSMSCVPLAGVEPANPCGCAGLSRVRLPFRHRGRAARRGLEPRSPRSERGVHANWTNGHPLGRRLPVQDSNLGSRIQRPLCCRLHQPGSVVWCPYQDSNLDWTRSERVASSVGLQGLGGHDGVWCGRRGACPGTRTLYLPFTRRVLVRSSLTGMSTCASGLRGVETRLGWLSTKCLCRLGYNRLMVGGSSEARTLSPGTSLRCSAR